MISLVRIYVNSTPVDPPPRQPCYLEYFLTKGEREKNLQLGALSRDVASNFIIQSKNGLKNCLQIFANLQR